MSISPTIFKAYDVRALYPSELNEPTAYLIGRAYVAYLESESAAGAEARISTLAVTAAGAWRVTTPKLATRAKGTGDVLAALFLGRYLEAGDAGAALGQAVSSVFGLIAAVGNTLGGEQTRDLPMVASRAEITDPATRFLAKPLD